MRAWCMQGRVAWVAVRFIGCVHTVRLCMAEAAVLTCLPHAANNQHEIGTAITKDPMQSSFCLAMQMCTGAPLTVWACCTHLFAVVLKLCCWCSTLVGCRSSASGGAQSIGSVHAAAHPPFVGSCFEESICLLQRTGKQLKLDIATIHVGKPCLIAEGHPDLESTKKFPLALMERGFSIDIAKAEATQEEDRRRILNSVAGKEEAELDTEPPTEHEKFTQVHTSSRKTPLVLMFQKQIEFSQEGVIFVVLPSEM